MKSILLKVFLGAAILSVWMIGIFMIKPAQLRTQPANAASECPEPNDKGVYFERGRDEGGNAICGFAYYNACPYYEGAEAGTPECEKAKPTPEQLEPWQPNGQSNTAQPEAVQCGGK